MLYEDEATFPRPGQITGTLTMTDLTQRQQYGLPYKNQTRGNTNCPLVYFNNFS